MGSLGLADVQSDSCRLLEFFVDHPPPTPVAENLICSSLVGQTWLLLPQLGIQQLISLPEGFLQHTKTVLQGSPTTRFPPPLLVWLKE